MRVRSSQAPHNAAYMSAANEKINPANAVSAGNLRLVRTIC
jgi:hypothetical protein